MSGICHLHVHSCYSFLEGLPTPVELARAAARDGMQALALTDHLSLSGAPAFYRACREEGVQPILGLEIDLLLPYHLSSQEGDSYPPKTGVLVLLASSRNGWRQICRLSSTLLSQKADSPTPAVSLEMLADYAEDLICLTGGCRGALDPMLASTEQLEDARVLLMRLREIFSERLFIEIHQQGNRFAEKQAMALQLCDELKLPAVACHSIYFLDPLQADLQRMTAAIRTNQRVDTLPAAVSAPENSSFPSTAAMQESFRNPEALAATAEIAKRCDWKFPDGQRNYPRPPLPHGISPDGMLRHEAFAGAQKMYAPLTAKVTQRIEHELETIKSSGYATLFLIAQEMIAYAREQNIPFASRGSASSSLVAHCIGITSPDPIALDLYFERFLNPARTTPPDIDTDFCSRRRDEVIQHLFALYGQDQVAMVGTVNKFRSRSALLAVAKAMGFPPAEMRALAKRLPWYEHSGTDGQPAENPYAGLLEDKAGQPRYRALFSTAQALIGKPRHLSVHPGGVVIAPGPVLDYVPVAWAGGKGVTITQFDLGDVEAFGLIKLDLLGIRGLTVMGDVARTLYEWRRAEYQTSAQILDSIPDQDTAVSEMVASGRTIGCFQIESPGMRATLRDIQASTPADIMAALALYRPGPLKGGLRDAFVHRHNHMEPVTHIHPALSQLLQETYGVILYQEQVLRIAHELAGMTLAEADLLRRAMSHVNPGKQMQLLQESFIAGAKNASGIPAQVGARIWEMMAAFAGYGFPKAHAASYAHVAWRSAWCKVYYPAEFLAAVLANHGGYYPQSVYLNEARRYGLLIQPPHINHAQSQFCVEYPDGKPVLYMGLDQVQDLTLRTQQRIQKRRPFSSLDDFLARVDPRAIEAVHLIEVGALSGLGSIPAMLRAVTGTRRNPGQLSLFAWEADPEQDWDVEEKAAAQRHWLGTSLEAHPLQLQQQQIQEAGAITTLEAAARVGQTVRVAGVRQSIQRSFTRQARGMVILVLEDLEGMLEVMLTPELYRRARASLFDNQSPLIVEGSVERSAATGEPVLRARTIFLLR